MNNLPRGAGHHRRARRLATQVPRARLAVLAVITAGLLILAVGCGGLASPRSPQSTGSSPAGGTATVGAGDVSYGLVNPPRGTNGTSSRTANGGPAREATGMDIRSGVTGGALFGGTATLTGEDARLGRTLAIVRVYYQIGELFPTRLDRRLMAQGSTMLVSLDTVPGGPTYSSIAAGSQDAAISAFLRAVNQAAVRYHLGAIYFSFEHEMNAANTHHGLGTPGQFIQAWDHIHQLAESAHVNWNDGGRIHWVFIMTHAGYVPMASREGWARDDPSPTAFWPGDSEVDIVAADGYNSDGCKLSGNSVTPEGLFGPLLSFARANGLPVFVAEWGDTPRDPGGGQATFIRQMESFVSANPEVAGVMYWNNMGRRCTFSIDNYPSAIVAMATMGHSPALQGHVI